MEGCGVEENIMLGKIFLHMHFHHSIHIWCGESTAICQSPVSWECITPSVPPLVYFLRTGVCFRKPKCNKCLYNNHRNWRKFKCNDHKGGLCIKMVNSCKIWIAVSSEKLFFFFFGSIVPVSFYFLVLESKFIQLKLKYLKKFYLMAYLVGIFSSLALPSITCSTHFIFSFVFCAWRLEEADCAGSDCLPFDYSWTVIEGT